MKNIKMVLLDMDGTLLNDEKEITSKTKEILIELQKAGITLVLASGRSNLGLIDYAQALDMANYGGYLISYNGACLYDLKEDKVIWEEGLKDNDVQEILKHLENFDVIPLINKDKKMFVQERQDYFIEYSGKRVDIIDYETANIPHQIEYVENLVESIDFPLRKILVAGDEDYLNKHAKKIGQPFEKTHTSGFTAPMYFEFTSNKADKGLAFKQLINKLDVDIKNTMAFGDGHNDLSLLKRVGTSVAMSNAVPEILAMADIICLSNNEDGIGVFLEENILKKKNHL